MAVLAWLAALFVLFTLGFELWPGASELLRFDRVSYERGAVWQLLSSQWVHLSRWHAAGNAFALVLIVFASGFWLRWPLQLLALCGGYAGVALVLALDPDCSYYAGASGALHGLLAGNAVAIAWLARPLRARSGISCTFGSPASGALRCCKSLVWHSHTARFAPSIASRIRRPNAQLIPERALKQPAGKPSLATDVQPSRRMGRAAIAVLGLIALKLWLQAVGLREAPPVGWGFPVYHPAHIAGALGGMGLVLLVFAARALAASHMQAEPGQ